MLYFKQSIKILFLLFVFFPFFTHAARPINGTIPKLEPILPPPINESQNSLQEDVNLQASETDTPGAPEDEGSDDPASLPDIEAVDDIAEADAGNPWVYVIGSIILGILGIVFLLKNKK